jgi:hypothetical protein
MVQGCNHSRLAGAKHSSDLSQRRGPFDIVTIYAEDPTGTPPFPRSRDLVVRSMILAVLLHFT